MEYSLHTKPFLEEEVLRLIALGRSNKEIAAQLKTDVETVIAQKSEAMKKLGLCSRVEIVRYAIGQGWIG
jgi:two-component system, NarL family, response regulator NreC